MGTDSARPWDQAACQVVPAGCSRLKALVAQVQERKILGYGCCCAREILLRTAHAHTWVGNEVPTTFSCNWHVNWNEQAPAHE